MIYMHICLTIVIVIVIVTCNRKEKGGSMPSDSTQSRSLRA